MTPPVDPVPRHVADAPAGRVAEVFATLGLAGPVLVVADDDAIATSAPAWADSFASARIEHRVVVHGVDVLAAAADFGARAIVAAGSGAAVAAARDAAVALGIPFVETGAPGG